MYGSSNRLMMILEVLLKLTSVLVAPTHHAQMAHAVSSGFRSSLVYNSRYISHVRVLTRRSSASSSGASVKSPQGPCPVLFFSLLYYRIA